MLTSLRCKSLQFLERAKQQVRDFLKFDAEHYDGLVCTYWEPLVKLAFPEMINMTLTGIVDRLLDWAVSNMAWAHEQLLDCIEYSSGMGNLSKGLIKEGFRVCSFDIIYSKAHDCLSASGLRLWITALCCLAPDGFIWFGTKCSSFVSICLAGSQRSIDNQFFGDHSKAFVQEGNSLMMITAFLFVFGSALNHHVTLEQPLNPIMKSVITFFSCKRCVTYLGAFGAPSMKPIQLISTRSLECLERDRPCNSSEPLASRGSNGEYTGKKNALKDSENYPVQFGRAVAKVFASQRGIVM